MLHAELHRLGKELSSLDAMLDDLPEDILDEEGATEKAIPTRTQQLNMLISFVTCAQKPLTVYELSLILEVVLEEEFLNLEDDLRKVYSSLFSLRPGDVDIENGVEKTTVIVTLRHSSFYEFFSASVTVGPIHVDSDQAEALFVYVLLHVLSKSESPYSQRSLWKINNYAQKFLGVHLSNADPEKATNRKEIARLLGDLLTDEPTFNPDHWLIETYYISNHARYIPYPSSSPTEVARYWWDTQVQDTANERADLVFKWLTPDLKQLLQDCARSSEVASDKCTFTVVFSRLAESFSRLWLVAKDIEADDGLSGTLCTMLLVYHQMAGTKLCTSEEKTVGLYLLPESRQILEIAEMQCLERTPIWHAKLAQALLHHYKYSAALEQFQLALDENHKNPILGKQAITVIHRDMARSCADVGRYKEALEHSNLAGSLQKDSMIINYEISKLLNTAQVEYYAGMTDQALSTVDEAWEAFVAQEREDHRDWNTFSSFFSILLELHQTQRIRPVFEFALSDLHGMESPENEMDRFIDSLGGVFPRTRLLYRVLHYVLMPDDGKYTDILVSIVDRLNAPSWKRKGGDEKPKYFLASLMFEHGLVSSGIQVWHDVAFLAIEPEDTYSKEIQLQSWSRLAAVCLHHPDSPLCEGAPVVLDESAESGDICLFVSSFLREHGDIPNARKALCGRVKRITDQLSDENNMITEGSFAGLFMTFLIAVDSDEDLNGALYLLKVEYEARRKWNKNRRTLEAMGVSHNNGAISGQQGDSENLSQVQSANNEVKEAVGEASEEEVRHILDLLNECAHCKCHFGPICHWYFCRSCPLMMLCRSCYCKIQSAISNPDTANNIRGICDPQHEFYSTGPPLRPDELVPEGMMVLQSADGKRQTIKVKEWLGKLSEKWGTADFEFEGGLSSWCMKVLPEPQRSRWATFFKT